MPYRTPPPEHRWPPHAALKRKAAARREREAARLRAEAEELERLWAEYVAKRDAAKAQAAQEVGS